MVLGFARHGKCDACGEFFENTEAKGFEMHEVAPDEWLLLCVPCAHAPEANEDK